MSLLFERTVTSALASLGLWIFLSFFMVIIAAALAGLMVSDASTPELQASRVRIEQAISRLSPATLFAEATLAVLTPTLRALGPVFLGQAAGAVPGPLPLRESLLLVWPHLTALFALVVICFGIGYVKFMREEIRA
jgi:ABC-2 type transport system permease protein